MSITSHGDCTPVANQFRDKVLRGLDELQKQVAVAGGVGEYINARVSVNIELEKAWGKIVWDGASIKVTELQDFIEPLGPGWVTLANWDSMFAGHLLSPLGGGEPPDPEGLRESWLASLYPQSMTNKYHLVNQLGCGAIPLDIEFEALGINLEALEQLCRSVEDVDDHSHYVAAATAILAYYEDRDDCGWVDPLDAPEIFDWLNRRGVAGELTSILTHPRRSA